MVIIKRILTTISIFILLIPFFTIAGCFPSSEQDFIDFAEVAAEEFLTSINNRDFEIFSKHLSHEMKGALPEEEFLRFATQIEGIIGRYVAESKKILKVEKQIEYIIVIYSTEYTKEPEGVIFTMTLQKVDGVIKIAGSWFDSSKLQGE